MPGGDRKGKKGAKDRAASWPMRGLERAGEFDREKSTRADPQVADHPLGFIPRRAAGGRDRDPPRPGVRLVVDVVT